MFLIALGISEDLIFYCYRDKANFVNSYQADEQTSLGSLTLISIQIKIYIILNKKFVLKALCRFFTNYIVLSFTIVCRK